MLSAEHALNLMRRAMSRWHRRRRISRRTRPDESLINSVLRGASWVSLLADARGVDVRPDGINVAGTIAVRNDAREGQHVRSRTRTCLDVGWIDTRPRHTHAHFTKA